MNIPVNYIYALGTMAFIIQSACSTLNGLEITRVNTRLNILDAKINMVNNQIRRKVI